MGEHRFRFSRMHYHRREDDDKAARIVTFPCASSMNFINQICTNDRLLVNDFVWPALSYNSETANASGAIPRNMSSA